MQLQLLILLRILKQFVRMQGLLRSLFTRSSQSHQPILAGWQWPLGRKQRIYQQKLLFIHITGSNYTKSLSVLIRSLQLMLALKLYVSLASYLCCQKQNNIDPSFRVWKQKSLFSKGGQVSKEKEEKQTLKKQSYFHINIPKKRKKWALMLKKEDVE